MSEIIPEKVAVGPVELVPPYPHTRAEVAADGLARHILAQAHLSASRSRELHQALMDARGTDAFDLHKAIYSLNLDAMTAEYGVAFLLAHLANHVPERADLIAAELWQHWEDAPLTQWTWAALKAIGIDPEAVVNAAAEASQAEQNGGAS